MADHFYTLDQNCEGSPAYGFESIECYVLPQGDATGVPLFRWWNVNSSDHFYTTDPNGELAATNGYVREGVACHVFPNAEHGTVPLHRWFHGKSGDHFYCVDPAGELAPAVGYVPEGVSCHVYRASVPGAVAFYRFFEKSTAWCIKLLRSDGQVVFEKGVSAIDQNTADAHAQVIMAQFNASAVPAYQASRFLASPGNC